MDFYTLTYREILKNELDHRISTNTLYSLRAFARDLDIPPGRMCEILQGKQGLSKKTAYNIALALQFNEKECDYFCTQVEATHARSKTSREAAKLLLAQFKENVDSFSENCFKVINDWYHFAVLDLTEHSDFKNDHEWIGKKLNIESHLVSETIERLLNLELLTLEDGKLKKSIDLKVPQAGCNTDLINKYYECVISKALDHLSNQKCITGNFSTMNLLLSAEQSEHVKRLFLQFERELKRISANTSVKDRLYMYSCQFFRLDEEDNQLCE